MLPVVKDGTRNALLKSFDTEMNGRHFFLTEVDRMAKENPVLGKIIHDSYYKCLDKYGPDVTDVIFKESVALVTVMYSLLVRQDEADQMDKAWGDAAANE